jgi:phosphatidylglycerol:prolipoprotein diacylglycerol transferase
MIRWYSLIAVAAIVVGFWIATKEAERKGLDKDVIPTIGLWVVPAGIVGARLFHVTDHWDDVYSLAPIRVFYIARASL